MIVAESAGYDREIYGIKRCAKITQSLLARDTLSDAKEEFVPQHGCFKLAYDYATNHPDSTSAEIPATNTTSQLLNHP